MEQGGRGQRAKSKNSKQMSEIMSEVSKEQKAKGKEQL